VTWIVDGKDSRREYATVNIQGEAKSLAEAVVEAGLAEVSLPPNAAKDAAAKPSTSTADDEGEKRVLSPLRTFAFFLSFSISSFMNYFPMNKFNFVSWKW
jgi:hypothetical protein